MLHENIKTVREFLELTSTQVASLLKINVYLYRKYEAGAIDISIDLPLLLSIAYKVPITFFISNTVTYHLCANNTNIQFLYRMPIKERVLKMYQNLFDSSPYPCKKVNYRMISAIRKEYLQRLSKNLLHFRETKGIDISTVAEVLNIKSEDYLPLEKGIYFPLVRYVVTLADFYQIDIQVFIEKSV